MEYTSLDCLTLQFTHYINEFCHFVCVKLVNFQKATERHVCCTEHMKTQLLFLAKIVICHHQLKHKHASQYQFWNYDLELMKVPVKKKKKRKKPKGEGRPYRFTFHYFFFPFCGGLTSN